MSAEDIYPEKVFTEKKNLSTEEWMERDWNERAKKDVKYFIRSFYNQSEEDFWASGRENCIQILGINSSRYDKILGDKDPKKMRILEIGCGIGRILIPMSKIFGEAIGVDVSQKMIELANDYLEPISNCKAFKTSGSDLKIFPDNHFDFCYSYIVFQHIPEKDIIVNYIREVSRIIKPHCLFRFQVCGKTSRLPATYNTWQGVYFSSKEIHEIAQENKFEILEEDNSDTQYYWLTFKAS